MTLFRSDGNESGSDVYPVCDVFGRTNRRCNYVAQFEEGDILTKTRNNVESGEESVTKSLMTNEQYMENLDSNDQSDHDLISTEMLEDIRDDSQTHPNVNKREACYEILERIRQKQSECKGEFKRYAQHGKGLNKVFSMIVK